MKKLLSLFLVRVTLLGILPTAAFAADSEEEALGEVNIYNGEYELGYLSINGSVRKQIYTYFLYERNNGQMKEAPTYCVNPTTPGVPQTVGPGESLAEGRASKRKVMQKHGKTELGKYSGKYALSELLVCGECGTPYKRCTWARNGKSASCGGVCPVWSSVRNTAIIRPPWMKISCTELLWRPSMSLPRLKMKLRRMC